MKLGQDPIDHFPSSLNFWKDLSSNNFIEIRNDMPHRWYFQVRHFWDLKASKSLSIIPQRSFGIISKSWCTAVWVTSLPFWSSLGAYRMDQAFLHTTSRTNFCHYRDPLMRHQIRCKRRANNHQSQLQGLHPYHSLVPQMYIADHGHIWSQLQGLFIYHYVAHRTQEKFWRGGYSITVLYRHPGTWTRFKKQARKPGSSPIYENFQQRSTLTLHTKKKEIRGTSCNKTITWWLQTA